MVMINDFVLIVENVVDLVSLNPCGQVKALVELCDLGSHILFLWLLEFNPGSQASILPLNYSPSPWLSFWFFFGGTDLIM